ncbi:hypothetical protein DXG01_011114 [Tephrocybe rancida]|nr:hypothetical protein DXG01_011114 [Tephrocybe rancida]
MLNKYMKLTSRPLRDSHRSTSWKGMNTKKERKKEQKETDGSSESDEVEKNESDDDEGNAPDDEGNISSDEGNTPNGDEGSVFDGEDSEAEYESMQTPSDIYYAMRLLASEANNYGAEVLFAVVDGANKGASQDGTSYNVLWYRKGLKNFWEERLPTLVETSGHKGDGLFSRSATSISSGKGVTIKDQAAAGLKIKTSGEATGSKDANRPKSKDTTGTKPKDAAGAKSKANSGSSTSKKAVKVEEDPIEAAKGEILLKLEAGGYLPPNGHLPWLTLARTLSQQGIQGKMWPHNIEFPGEFNYPGKGIVAIPKESARMLLVALRSETNPLTFEKVGDEDRKRRY